MWHYCSCQCEFIERVVVHTFPTRTYTHSSPAYLSEWQCSAVHLIVVYTAWEYFTIKTLSVWLCVYVWNTCLEGMGNTDYEVVGDLTLSQLTLKFLVWRGQNQFVTSLYNYISHQGDLICTPWVSWGIHGVRGQLKSIVTNRSDECFFQHMWLPINTALLLHTLRCSAESQFAGTHYKLGQGRERGE